MWQLGQLNPRNPLTTLLNLAEAPESLQAGQWREGHDFVSWQQAERLVGCREMRRPAPRWWAFTVQAIRDLQRWETTGEWPEGKLLCEQARWQVELWEAYWEGARARVTEAAKG